MRRFLSYKEKELLLKSKDLKSIKVEDETLLDAENIAFGGFYPLEGFLTEEELIHIANRMQLPQGDVWTIPVLLQLRERPKVEKGESLLLVDKNGNPKALVEVKDVYRVDLKKIAKLVWGTENEEHPGVRKFYSSGEWCVGGPVWLIDRVSTLFKDWVIYPDEVKKVFMERGWKKVVGFQTRNAPHRGHEYLHRMALEFADGLFINPVLGWKKSDDFDPQIILTAYTHLINNHYPKNRVFLSGIMTHMRYAGPREAVFHAIIRRNFGCTHFMVGRDHAGVGSFYDPYESHSIFDKLPADIGIEIIRFSEAFYCKKCECVASERTCGHSEENRVRISMTKIRSMLYSGQSPPKEMIREDLAELLIKMMKNFQSF